MVNAPAFCRVSATPRTRLGNRTVDLAGVGFGRSLDEGETQEWTGDTLLRRQCRRDLAYHP